MEPTFEQIIGQLSPRPVRHGSLLDTGLFWGEDEVGRQFIAWDRRKWQATEPLLRLAGFEQESDFALSKENPDIFILYTTDLPDAERIPATLQEWHAFIQAYLEPA